MQHESEVYIIIQARTGSTRLPNKLILPFHKGKGIFEILLERLTVAKILPPENIILATSGSDRNNILADIATGHGCVVFRGDEEDVLGRFIGAAAHFDAKRIIRVCADNPFLDIASLSELINAGKFTSADYLAFFTAEGLPSIRTHFGFWAEYVRTEALKKVAALTNEPYYHEHVTNYIYGHESLFDIARLPIPTALSGAHGIRLTLDTAADFEMQQEIYSRLAGNVSIAAILEFLKLNPQYPERMEIEINSNKK